jgi:hypothetical protein
MRNNGVSNIEELNETFINSQKKKYTKKPLSKEYYLKHKAKPNSNMFYKLNESTGKELAVALEKWGVDVAVLLGTDDTSKYRRYKKLLIKALIDVYEDNIEVFLDCE